ncbi:tubulin polyglutamylase TTLL5 isoform X1, partial [Clarias magur]
LYGFDVLIDSNLKPWLLEVNLSPSLACDTPLDLKIKASMISDMFSLVGFVCQDPLLKQMRTDKGGLYPAVKNHKTLSQRPKSANNLEDLKEKQGGRQMDTLGLTAEELKVLRRTQEEHERRGGFIRIFPTPQTWERYSGYLEYKTSMNSMLANKLFQARLGKFSVTTQFRNRLKGNVPLEEETYKTCHVVQYESKLLSLEERRHRKRHTAGRDAAQRRKTGRRPLSSLAHSSENEEADEAEERGPQGKQEHTMSLARTHPQPTLLEKHQAEEQFPARVSKPKVDLLHILQQGWDLSKVQARMAFSSYLHRVQLRLLIESRTNSAWAQKDNDQMELVMRFLMRAASNLKQDMKVLFPSRQLSLPDRRRILAHQLGEFIHCYNQETEQMVKCLEKTEDEDRCINSNVFLEFILEASERDLEDILTFYTHKNKTASVFLGSPRRDTSGEPAMHHSRKTLLNAKETCSASGLSLTAKTKSPKNEEIQESVTRPGYNKSSITVNTNSHSNIVLNSDKYSTLNNSGHKNNKTVNGNTVTEGQSEALTTCEIQNNVSKTRGLKDGEFQSKSSHVTVVGNDNELSKHVKEIAVRPETAKSYKSHVKAQSSQHTSSHRPALDCEHIHLQQCFPRSEHEAQLQTRPPPYIHPPPHLHAESQSKPQTTLSSSSTNSLRPTRVMWASSNSSTPRSFATTEVLQQNPSSQMPQQVSSGISFSSACTTKLYSQKVLSPSSEVQVVSNKASKSKPASAGVLKVPDSLSAQAQSNQAAIVAALKKLVEKQAARQYSTSSHISLLTQHLSNLNLAKGVFSRGAQSIASETRPDTATTQHLGMNLSGAVSHSKDAGDGKCQDVCNLTSEATLQPATGTYAFAIQKLQQQKLQSRKLLDQSRSRHQAMLDGHTLVPGVVSRNPDPSTCSIQVTSQTRMKETASRGNSCYPQSLVSTHDAALALIPKPPSSTPKDAHTGKTATQRTNHRAAHEALSGNGLSSRQNVYDITCGKK